MAKAKKGKSKRGASKTQRERAEAVSTEPEDTPQSPPKGAATATEEDWDLCDIARVLESGKYTPHGEKRAVPGHRVAWEPAKDASAEQLAYWTEREWVESSYPIPSAGSSGGGKQQQPQRFFVEFKPYWIPDSDLPDRFKVEIRLGKLGKERKRLAKEIDRMDAAPLARTASDRQQALDRINLKRTKLAGVVQEYVKLAGMMNAQKEIEEESASPP